MALEKFSVDGAKPVIKHNPRNQKGRDPFKCRSCKHSVDMHSPGECRVISLTTNEQCFCGGFSKS